jgi:hypothetical protein
MNFREYLKESQVDEGVSTKLIGKVTVALMGQKTLESMFKKATVQKLGDVFISSGNAEDVIAKLKKLISSKKLSAAINSKAVDLKNYLDEFKDLD